MGINIRVQKSPKLLDVITARVKLERDLKSCMRCRFFYGSSSQCIAKQCVKEEGEAEISEPDMGVNALNVRTDSQRSIAFRA